MRVIDRDEVARRLDHHTCIGLMRDAMIALSAGRSTQLLRSILDLGGGDAFGVMPGALDGAGFGAKMVSVFPGAAAQGRSHQGVIVLFDRNSGAPVAIVDAGEVTAIRTASASAVATDALARPDARRLAILGTGEQAWHHAVALSHVRRIDEVRIWGRDASKAAALAGRIAAGLGLTAYASPSAAAATEGIDIICTVTAAPEPVLHARHVSDGAHINLVGSSRAGPAEIDVRLVARSRFFPDHRAGVLVQGAEYLNARAAELVEEGHVLPEIGLVLSGDAEGRRSVQEVTIYKSLGSVVQDLACAAYLASADQN